MSDKSGNHVHWHDDGRGEGRAVFIDGVVTNGVIYADTKAGIAVVHDIPLRTTDGEHADFHPVWGEVRVYACGGYVRSPSGRYRLVERWLI